MFAREDSEKDNSEWGCTSPILLPISTKQTKVAAKNHWIYKNY